MKTNIAEFLKAVPNLQKIENSTVRILAERFKICPKVLELLIESSSKNRQN